MSNETKNMEELAQPGAYDYQIASACIADGHNKKGKWVDWNNKLTRYCPPDWMVEEGKVTTLKPLYSHEFVCALLAELEVRDERIAELEAKLAKPVRLPPLPEYRHNDRQEVRAEKDGFISGVEESASALREQGYAVEGDK